MEAKELYHAGIYLRLSRDDGIFGEGGSIASQRELCAAFVEKCTDMNIYDIYVDDGYSGANFDRPDFKRMMEDVKGGLVDCIVVKDLSRFGRDYIEAGRLIQKTFPALNVRFIAVTDHFDSLTANYHESTLVLPVKNFVNDSYCRDISNKVKSHQRMKREKGEFIGAFAPYGYMREEKHKNRLVPDPYAAGVVRDIFKWKTEGMSNLAIAERLNGAGVLSPMEYKKRRGENYSTGFAVRLKAEWSAVAVKRILTNEVYTGTMVQGKSEKINYKLAECRPRPQEQWVRVKGTHEPIVMQEEFDRVQRLLAAGIRAPKGQTRAHMFSGLLYCGDCREPMTRRVNRYQGGEKIYFICSTQNKGRGCDRHSISEEELKEAVLNGLKLQTALFLEDEKVLSGVGALTVSDEEQKEREQEVVRLRREEEKYLSLKDDLREDVKRGILTQEDYDTFQSIYEKQQVEIQKSVRRQEEGIAGLVRLQNEWKAWLETFQKRPRLEVLDREMLLAFVDRILVYEDKRICLEVASGEKKGIFSRDLCQTVRGQSKCEE